MTQETIDKLPEILKGHMGTMRKVSYDESKAVYMSDSRLRVINFDKIPKEYARGKGWTGVPASNDALYIDEDGGWYFIEFKNGTVEKADLLKKIYDSLIMLLDLGIIPDILFIQKNIQYILVYNQEKYQRVQQSESRSRNQSYLLRLAKTEEILFGMEKLEGYLLKDVHTYTKEDFQEKFIKIMEKQELRCIKK